VVIRLITRLLLLSNRAIRQRRVETPMTFIDSDRYGRELLGMRKHGKVGALRRGIEVSGRELFMGCEYPSMLQIGNIRG